MFIIILEERYWTVSEELLRGDPLNNQGYLKGDAQSIEMTAFALLLHMHTDMAEGVSATSAEIASWLSRQKNKIGSFNAPHVRYFSINS